MTGFGKASCELESKIVNIEVKALNSKQLDLFTRLPNLYREKDFEIRNELASCLKRGKIELSINVDFKDEALTLKLNANVIKIYYKQLQDILKEFGNTNSEPIIQAVMRIPEVYNSSREQLDEKEWTQVALTVNKAIRELNDFRDQEGKAMRVDLLNRIQSIEDLFKQIEPYEKERINSFKDKLSSNLQELFPNNSYDGNRLEQEMIFYLEKLDITEEKIRLANHCMYFRNVMDEEEAVGKKLGFVAQEIGREINTLGSKANHSDIQRLVVLMKDELEKIKEQMMNIL
jgi:uncharacterized protein (TIGR00255 family)